MLPLNVCSVLIWLSGFMLIFKNRPIYEFAYFLGITACANYLLTPDLGIYGFPHYRFIETFISHGLVITAADLYDCGGRLSPNMEIHVEGLCGDKHLYGYDILYQHRAGFQLLLPEHQTNRRKHV